MEALNRFVWIFVSPGRVFADIREGKAPWWHAWLFVSVVAIVIGFFALPIQRALAALNPSDLPADQLEKQLEFIDNFGWVQVLITPVVALITAVLLSGVTYVLVSLLSEQANFKKYLAVMLYASCVAVVAQVVSTLVVRMRGVDTIRSAEDAQASLSLAYLLQPDGRVLKGLMGSIEVFGIWSLILVAMGLMQVFGMPRNKALAVVIPLWLVSAGFAIAGQMMSGLG